MQDEQVMFTLSGKCYHKFKYVKTRYGAEYIQSECGIIDNINWNAHFTDLGCWWYRKLRPCKRCYGGEK